AAAAGAADEAAAAPPIESPGLFVCTATSVMQLNGDGKLENTNFAKAVKMYEARFAVDRGTGMTLGGPFATWDARSVTVLNPGSDTEGFKVAWMAEAAWTHFKYLSVQSYVDGPKKPFLGLTGDVVLTGTCE
ncbi:MAG: hypothetical protein ACU85V_10795, partial [Gammaproteobacteria bacterium]